MTEDQKITDSAGAQAAFTLVVLFALEIVEIAGRDRPIAAQHQSG
ncbi:hypothetical protein [Sphingobium yanoikuyae]|nr:hypothetical protein [Sphingobium yanoikuyae]